MAPYGGEPDWATPGDTSNAGAAGTTPTSTTNYTNTGGSGSGGNNANSADDRNQARMVVLGLSLLNLGLSAMMGSLGVLSLVKYEPSSVNDVTQAFLSVYMIIFAALLFCYEMIWWQPIDYVNIIFRKNFGFLYGLKGKGFYLIFIAFLTLGLLDEDSTAVKGLDWATGIGWLCGGLLHLFIGCWFPAVQHVYKPPTAGLSTMGQDANKSDDGNNNPGPINPV